MEQSKQIYASCAYTKYDFEVRNNEEAESHSLSNNLIVDLISPKIKFEQTLTSPKQINQEQLSYQLIIENNGDIEISNISISNPINNDVSFISKSLTIDGKKNDSNLFNGLELEKITPKQRVIIKYKLGINKECLAFKISNLSTMNYEYKLNNNIYKESIVSNTVYADLIKEIITVNKVANKKITTTNETITISTIINNLGNTPIRNLKIDETSNNNFSLVENSIFINGNLSELNDLSSIFIPFVKEGTQIIVSYDIRTKKPPLENDKIEIESKITYTCEETTVVINTNKVKIDINYAYLVIKKSVDKQKAKIGEQLGYQVEIRNIGNIKAKNIFFSDVVAEGMRFINESLFINDVNKTDLNPTLGFLIDDLKANESVIISYRTLII